MFSKLDLTGAYLQLNVIENCSEFLTINTHKCLYKLNVLLFGLKIASNITQEMMDTKLAGMD